VPTPGDQTRAGYIPEEFAQFYIDFQANWSIQSSRLKKAMDDAVATAQGKHTDISGPPWTAGCARVIGYPYLLLNEYNTSSATW
jgi:hypothetical protein